jgi:hypothetical protein
MNDVKYFNSHSTRLWFWRIRLAAGIRRKVVARIAAERRPGPVVDHGTAKVPVDLAVEFFARAQAFEHRAETSSDVRVMNENLRMAEHYLERSRKADAFAG